MSPPIRWFESKMYRPTVGASIYLWDAVNKKRISTVCAEDDDYWDMFPRWAYKRSGNEPICVEEYTYDS